MENSKNSKDYDSLKREFEVAAAKIAVMDRLIECGVPKKDAHYFSVWACVSGYSMGEQVVINCNGEPLVSVDNRRMYSGKCRGREIHGLLVYNFTKKALREYVSVCKKSVLAEAQLSYLKNAPDAQSREQEIRECRKAIEGLDSLKCKLMQAAYSPKESRCRGYVGYWPRYLGYNYTCMEARTRPTIS